MFEKLILRLDASWPSVLELDPENHAAIQTHIQILLSLDRYKDALSFILSQEQSKLETSPSSSSQWQLEQAYALYKLGKVPDAATIVEAIRADSMQLDEEADYARAVDVLDAQVVCILHITRRYPTLTIDVVTQSRNTVWNSSIKHKCCMKTFSRR